MLVFHFFFFYSKYAILAVCDIFILNLYILINNSHGFFFKKKNIFALWIHHTLLFRPHCLYKSFNSN